MPVAWGLVLGWWCIRGLFETCKMRLGCMELPRKDRGEGNAVSILTFDMGAFGGGWRVLAAPGLCWSCTSIRPTGAPRASPYSPCSCSFVSRSGDRRQYMPIDDGSANVRAFHRINFQLHRYLLFHACTFATGRRAAKA